LKAFGVACMNNHRQLMIAWRSYSEENREVLLFATADANGPNEAYSWVQGVLDFNGGNRSNWDVEKDIKRSPLWQYSGKSPAIWKCPADQSTVVPTSGPFENQTVPRVRTMAMSIWVGGWEGHDAGCSGPEWRVYRKFGDFSNPGPARTRVL